MDGTFDPGSCIRWVLGVGIKNRVWHASPRGWRPDPFPFNTIPGFWYGTSLRGLCPNDFSCGFISIKMARIVIGSPNLTQPLLLYPGLGPTMYENSKQAKRHTNIPHGKPKIWYHLIVGWVLIFWEVWGKLIGEDLDVDDEGSEQHQFESVQSLHHSSIGYQPVHTWIALAKKAMSLQGNWGHKQE
jgi:hypothetical protein